MDFCSIFNVKSWTFVAFCSILLHIISTDEDPGLRIESFVVINLRGVSTNKTIIYFIAMQTYKELISNVTCKNLLLSTHKPHLNFFQIYLDPNFDRVC